MKSSKLILDDENDTCISFVNNARISFNIKMKITELQIFVEWLCGVVNWYFIFTIWHFTIEKANFWVVKMKDNIIEAAFSNRYERLNKKLIERILIMSWFKYLTIAFMHTFSSDHQFWRLIKNNIDLSLLKSNVGCLAHCSVGWVPKCIDI